jgi:Fic family protein
MRDISDVLQADPRAAVTEDLIVAIHRTITRDIAYEHNVPGQYRSHAVTVGRYTPPRDRDSIVRLMRDFVRWVNGPATSGWPASIKAVAAHFYLVSIHPFGDGNGRTSRAIESFLLRQGGINALGFYSLSNFYYEHQDEYRRLLDRVIFGSDNNLMPFVTFALEGLVVELAKVYEEGLAEVRVATFREIASARVGGARFHAKTRERLIELLRLFEEPVDISEVQSGSHRAALLYRTLSDKTFRRDLAALQRLELVVIHGSLARVNFDLLTGDS